MAETPSPLIEDKFVRVRDGMRLHVRCYRAPNATRRPAVCLPGLTRNGRDFHDLACALSDAGPLRRTVYAIDYRGRGHSEWDSDWRNYTVPNEALDVIDFLISEDLHDVAIIGTSRGGLIAMVLAAMQPTAIGAVVLNDIGPVVESDGLFRIAGYVGRIPTPHSWKEAAEIARDINQRWFPKVEPEVWDDVARQLFNEVDGRPSAGYDPKLMNSLSVLDGPMPALWPQFEALTRVPMMVIRGERSDILSEATVDEMRQRHPQIQSLVVPHQGHAPLLKDELSQSTISQFLTFAEDEGQRAYAVPAAPMMQARRAANDDSVVSSLSSRITSFGDR